MKKIFLVLIIGILNFQNSSTQTLNKYTIKNLNSNQPYPDKGVSFFDEDFVVFSAQIENTLGTHSRKRRRNKKKNIKLLTQNLEFYFTPIDENGNFINNQKLNNVINSGYDDYGLTFSKDQSVVYFAREMVKKNSDEKHLEIFTANVISPGAWVDIRKLNINHPEYSVGYPCLSEDDKTLYFVSNKEGDLNIYKVTFNEVGTLGSPIKLPSNINSSSNETTPFVFNNKLYFSSDKSGGLGGFDIYSVDLNNLDSEALRIEEPINSAFDDTNFIKKSLHQGFFVSNRSGGKGKEDIYFFKENIVDNIALATTNKNINKIFQDEEEKMLASNEVKSSEKNIVSSELQSEKVQSNIVKEKVRYIKNDTVYDYQRRDSYDAQKEKIETSFGKIDKSKDEYSKCQMEFDRLSNIYFDYSESYIRADAAIDLNKVIRVMRLCPKIKVVAASHTDSRASYDYNLGLSQQRSMSVVNYIVENGKFSPDRIIGIGYGETRLANRCSDGVKCTEKEHQLNRRTHFEISNY